MLAERLAKRYGDKRLYQNATEKQALLKRQSRNEFKFECVQNVKVSMT